MPKVLQEVRVFPPPEAEVPKGCIIVSERKIREDDGSTRNQFIWVRGGFVVVVPVDADGNIFLKSEFKYGQMQELLTFPSGGVRTEEQHVYAAKRELREELGMEATSFTLLLEVFNSPDKSTEFHSIFLALGVTKIRDLKPEPGKIFTYSKEELHRIMPIKIALQRLALYESLHYLATHT